MKFTHTAAPFLATVVTTMNPVRGFRRDTKEESIVITQEKRVLRGKEYKTDYTEYCGCTYDFIKEVAAAQQSIVSDLNSLFYSESSLEGSGREIYDAIEDTAMTAAKCLQKLDCSCESARPGADSTEYDSAYKQCCCDADIIKDVYISQMDSLANIPECYLALANSDPQGLEPIIDAIKEANNGILSDIKSKYEKSDDLHRTFFAMRKELKELSRKEPRSFTGDANNMEHLKWGSANTYFLRNSQPAYQDGEYEPSGKDRPNPRNISNIVMDQQKSKVNTKSASDMLWQWGQFLDHDITLVPESEDHFDIVVPECDIMFDPNCTGTEVIPLKRSVAVDGEQQNHNTAYIDASQVYGSDEARAQELRNFANTGLLKVSEGNFLPFNENGFPNAPVDDDPSLFLAGDMRCNEQVYLTAMHTVFFREHNVLARILSDVLPGASDEEIYQLARRIVGAEMQQITYNEFLPMMLGENAMGDYGGYDATVDAGISNEFSTAAFRVGHTMLSSQMQCLDPNQMPLDQGPLELKDTFFNPKTFMDIGPGALMRGETAQMCQDVDSFVISDVRNFLFGPPFFGFLDLASLNIQRGRDHGLGSLNEVRQAYKLERHSTFSDVTSDKEVASRLAEAYESVDGLDPWVGGIAEDHLPGAMVGETFYTILHDQFTRLRDGDRFYFEHDLPGPLVEFVKSQRLSDIIARHTDTKKQNMPEMVMENPWMMPGDMLQYT